MKETNKKIDAIRKRISDNIETLRYRAQLLSELNLFIENMLGEKERGILAGMNEEEASILAGALFMAHATLFIANARRSQSSRDGHFSTEILNMPFDVDPNTIRPVLWESGLFVPHKRNKDLWIRKKS